ncbi:MAG TPA: 50S ribosomal protein L21 [Paenalcaligenes sp.]|nr:50S ribosomal protein L21 [Paenalcaligenes sp.]HLR81606.1 50S ribosomal protein L21 [Paenalcaligenes sp.]HLS16952.1 50S ribosomal protein L21 [Paenalcaligenes sp.]
MYAVIKTGGKQYRVSPGQKLKVEQIPADIGQEITLDQVLSVGEGDTIKVGTPYVSGAVVKATILAQGRHKKIKVFKMRRRKGYRRTQGHRQNYTELRIDAVEA